MNDVIRQLLQLSPGIMAGLKGDGNAMKEFMASYQQTSAQLQQQRERQTLLQQQGEDRQRGITRQNEADRIAAEERTNRQTQQGQADALQRLQIPGQLAELGGTADDPQSAQRLIESVMPGLMSAFGQDTMAMGMPAVEMATRTITARQKRQVKEFVDSALKTSHVADNPDADPLVSNLPAHVAKVLGKDTAKLSELQQFAELPVGKPAGKPSDDVSLQQKDMLVNGKLTPVNYNPKTGTYTDQSGRPVVAEVVPPKPGAGSDPEIAELRKELLRLQVQNAGKEKEPNQGQFTAGAYAGRMAQAEPILTKVAPSIVSMSLPSFSLQTDSWFAKPTFQSAEVQSYMQAARNFINAVLRRESGAVISPEEFANAKSQYLPIAGDDAQSLAQKAANREYVMSQMKRAAGSAYEAPITPPAAPAPTAKAPAKGERRKINGELGEWDGAKWIAVVGG